MKVLESARAEARLAAARDFVLSQPPGVEALIVAASRGAADDFARTLAVERGVTVGLHRFSFTQLAARLAAPALARRGVAPGTTLSAEAVAARATFEATRDDALEYFRPVASMPGFPRALARTLQELRLAGVSSERVAALPQSGSDLAELVDRFEAQFDAASVADRALLFRAAAAEAAASPLLRHPVLLLDVPIDAAAELQFLNALLTRASSAVATLAAGDDMTRSRFESIGAAVETLDAARAASDLDALRRYLFSGEQPPERSLLERGGGVEIFSAPGEGRECVEIARRILSEADRGVPFDRMAIFLRAPQAYLGLLEHALVRARVPAYFDRGTRRPHPAGRAFLAMLGCACERLSARRFAEYLSLGQVPTPDDLRETADRWAMSRDEVFGVLSEDRLAERDRRAPENAAEAPPYNDSYRPSTERAPRAREGTERGEGDPASDRAGVWGGTITERARRAREGAERGEGDPASDRAGVWGGAPRDNDEPIVDGTLRAPWRWEQALVESSVIGGDPLRWSRRLSGLEQQYRHQLSALRRDDPESPRIAGIERDLKDLRHLRAFALPLLETMAAWPPAARWGDWLARLAAFASRILRDPDQVMRVLADLRPMAEIGPVSVTEVRDVLVERLRTLEALPPTRRYGSVFIGSPHQARGRVFDVVFVPGLAERVFPQRLREDPMLLDDARTTLDASLLRRDDRVRLERLLLRLAVGAATARVYLSYPRIEVTEARSRVPSFYLLDVMRAVSGRIPSPTELERHAEAAADASLAWPSPKDAHEAIDDFEHDLAVLQALIKKDRADARGRAHYMLRLNACLRRAVVGQWQRGRRSWSPADGVVRVTEATAPVLATQRLNARAYSLTALQRFAACPYQFLLATIHRLRPFDPPQPLQRLDPLTRGSLVHEVQAKFFRALQKREALPIEPGRMDEALRTLDEEIENVARKYRDDCAPAIDRVWDDEIAMLRQDLRVWARQLVARDGDWEPWLFEFAFGLHDEETERDPRSVPDPVTLEGRFLLHGSVDLVERSRTGSGLRVTDHKTGKNRTNEALVVAGGKVLQPVLYSLVVEAVCKEPVQVGRLFFCTSAGGFTERQIQLTPHARRQGVETLEVVDRAIELGQLAAAPDVGACGFCDFTSVCGPNVERRLRKKALEPLADLLELRRRP
jgi:ATP-dependent helicase/nuclease subunit B